MTLQLTVNNRFYSYFPYVFLGWNWALRTGEGNRNLRSISPEAMSHSSTFQSVEELSSFRLLLFQLWWRRTKEGGEEREEGGEEGGEERVGVKITIYLMVDAKFGFSS